MNKYGLVLFVILITDQFLKISRNQKIDIFRLSVNNSENKHHCSYSYIIHVNSL